MALPKDLEALGLKGEEAGQTAEIQALLLLRLLTASRVSLLLRKANQGRK